MNKYKFTYYLNTATAERRPTTKEDIENDWKEEEQEFNSDLEAFEYVYTDILDEYEAGLYDLDEFCKYQLSKLEFINVAKYNFIASTGTPFS